MQNRIEDTLGMLINNEKERLRARLTIDVEKIIDPVLKNIASELKEEVFYFCELLKKYGQMTTAKAMELSNEAEKLEIERKEMINDEKKMEAMRVMR